jgi:ubiquinone/menaquinone biosynthesis C-methylase UbiE
MSNLPARDASIDILMGGYALRNAPDLDAFIREARRVLRPGGVAAFLEFSRPDEPWRARAQGALLRMWGGLLGLALHRDPHVYGYIASSLERFPTRSALLRRFLEAGFGVRVSLPRFFGMIELTIVERLEDAC